MEASAGQGEHGTLRNRGLRPEEVFLMTLDDCGNMFVQKKEGA